MLFRCKSLDTSDTPSSGLKNEYKRVVRSDFFQTYLMYRPDGDSIWVSLEVIDWSWAGSATKTTTGWQGGGEAQNDEKQETDKLPVWTGYVENTQS